MKHDSLILSFFLAGISFSFNAFSQPAINWKNCYGGSAADGASHIIRTSDGGFLTVGQTLSNDFDVSGNHLVFNPFDSTWGPNLDAWVLKTDSIGSIQWQKCLGGSGYDWAVAAVETQTGYVIACEAGSNDGDISFQNGGGDYWIVKIDLSGNLIWQHAYGGTDVDIPYGIAKYTDGGFIMSGKENSLDGGDVLGHHGPNGSGDDIWVIRLDSAGNLLWQKCLGGSSEDHYGTVAVDAIGNIYIAGVTASTDGDVTSTHIGSAWLVKLDASGNILWNQRYGGSIGEEIYSIHLKDSKLLMAGFSLSSDGNLPNNYGYNDAWILLTDTSGNVIFSQNYGGSSVDAFFDVKFTDDNKIIAGGWSNSTDFQVTMNHPFFSSTDCWLACVDSSGNLLWQNTYGGDGNENISSLLPLSGGGIQFAGGTQSGNNGDVTGFHDSLGYFADVWLVNLNSVTGINENEFTTGYYSIYPNPSNGNLTIHFNNNNSEKNIQILDVTGKIIYEKNKIKNADEVINLTDTPKGLYFLKIIEKDKITVDKIVIQ